LKKKENDLPAGGFPTCCLPSNLFRSIIRFAAKEAVIKAFPARALTFRDIQIRLGPAHGERQGEPQALVFDHAYFSGPQPTREDESVEAGAEHPARDYDLEKTVFECQTVHISISHDGDYATAVAIAPEEAMPGDVGGEAAARGL
jgi:holo-[acyl-carrier protein] synthase